MPWQRRSVSCCLQAVGAKAPRCRALGILRVEPGGGGTEGNLLRVLGGVIGGGDEQRYPVYPGDHASLRYSICESSVIVIISWSVVRCSADRQGLGLGDL